MKYILPLVLLGMLACRQPTPVEVPMDIRIDGVAVESLTDEPPYVPTPRWKVEPISLEAKEATENSDGRIDGAVYWWGGIETTFSTEGRNLRLDCSTGGAATIFCLANEAALTVTCERMTFKFSCELK